MKFNKKNKDVDLFYLDTYETINEVEQCGCDNNCGCTINPCTNNYEGCGAKTNGVLSDGILLMGTIYD